nr:immunoglobulin heavy chain junction region [Mus musculus]
CAREEDAPFAYW